MTRSKPAALIRISRPTIEHGRVDRVAGLFERLVPAKLLPLRNQVVFQVEGYDGDGRELFEVEEVRGFFARLFDACRDIFYWLEVSDEGLLFLALMVCPAGREGAVANIDGRDLQDFIAAGLEGLADFCAAHGIDPGPTERAVTALVRRKVGQ